VISIYGDVGCCRRDRPGGAGDGEQLRGPRRDDGTNTGPSRISGNLGVSPGSAVTGFPPGLVSNGTIHSADGVAADAQSDLTTAYNDAAGRSPTANVPRFIGGDHR
jgi:hypothetical protein